MAINKRCPRCGGTYVQLSAERSKHGFFYYLVFGCAFIWWRIIKAIIGILILLYYDWYMAIISKVRGKGYVWKCKGWFSGKKRIYYCHTCGYNFRE